MKTLLMPGGLGTLDELFEALTLVQTRKVRRMPVILVHSAFWHGLTGWIRTTLVDEKMIDPEDVDAWRFERLVEELRPEREAPMKGRAFAAEFIGTFALIFVGERDRLAGLGPLLVGRGDGHRLDGASRAAWGTTASRCARAWRCAPARWRWVTPATWPAL